MDRKLSVGDYVIYTDEHRVDHDALVTIVWSSMGGVEVPGCNLLFVSSDESKSDNYGRQIERRSSTCHRSANPARANCWRWPDEA